MRPTAYAIALLACTALAAPVTHAQTTNGARDETPLQLSIGGGALYAPTYLGSDNYDADRKDRDRANITAALRNCGGRIFGPNGAAALLGVKPTTLASRIRVLGIDKSGLAETTGR